MFGWDCWCFDQLAESSFPDLAPFSLPAPLPQWPKGDGFSSGKICLGELEVVKITTFRSVWISKSSSKKKGVTFIKPISIPDGFYSLGDSCHPNSLKFHGYALAVREINDSTQPKHINIKGKYSGSPALTKPLKCNLIWSSDSQSNGPCFIWKPVAPQGYKAMGNVVTDSPDEPSTDEIRCVREDITESCEPSDLLLSLSSFQVWSTRPCFMGMHAKGVSVGTFCCSASNKSQVEAYCLKNTDSSFKSMPTIDQIHALIQTYGPKLYFHPEESFFPSSVQWFFKNGALLFQEGCKEGEPIAKGGSNLPSGGINDGYFWIDLPEDEESRELIKNGNLESSLLYVHVKPAIGGTFTDIAMWVFCPFNGPGTLKFGAVTIPMGKIGQHVGDWEHFTLRVCNFTGELWQLFCSEHSGGRWVDASELEFVEDNKAAVYSSKHGHASYPHPGTYLQGIAKFGVGLRNDVDRSEFYIDSSSKYEVVSAEYLGEGVVEEPLWLQYMREWGPTIVYNSRSEIDKLLESLPFFIRFSVENFIYMFPTEIYGEEGPTGPKEKYNWAGDEIC